MLNRNSFYKKFSGQVLFSDYHKIKEPHLIIKKLPQGSIFIMRDMQNYSRVYLQLCRKICWQNKIYFFISASIRIATLLKADGIHYKENQKQVRSKQYNSRFLLSNSCHKYSSIIAANGAKRDLIFYSPLFMTSSHPGKQALGTVRFAKQTKGFSNIVALGGIKPQNIKRLDMLNIIGFAAIDYFAN